MTEENSQRLVSGEMATEPCATRPFGLLMGAKDAPGTQTEVKLDWVQALSRTCSTDVSQGWDQ